MSVVPILWAVIFVARLVLQQRDRQWERQHQPAGPAPAGSGSVLQTQLRLGFVLYVACILFPIGLTASVWMAYKYDDLTLSLVTFLLVAYAVFQLPHWLAWRVLAPLGRVRAARLALRLACFLEGDDRRGSLQLLEAVYGQGWRPGPGKVTLWTVFAMAAQAEREDDPERADLILEGIQRLGRIPYTTLRKQGLELLAWPAIGRKEWQKAFYRLEAGRGRGARLLRLLAQAHEPVEKEPSALALWLAWLLAPGRRHSLPYVQEALKAREGSATAALPGNPEPVEETGSVHLRHLHFLERVAAGRAVRISELESLAMAWEEVLEGAGHARVLSRGLELGVRGVGQEVESLRSSVIGELEVLARVAEGPWSVEEDEGLAGTLRSRQIEGLLRVLERETEGFPSTGELDRELDPPQVELDRWYRFRRDFERLRAAGGEDALLTAWFNGLRYVACNWPVDLGKACPGQAALACREMHLWSASLAGELGDAQISQLSSSNALHVK